MRDEGWFTPHNQKTLRQMLNPDMKVSRTAVNNTGAGLDTVHILRLQVVIELGSYAGKSTRFICQHAPNALVYCVDLWSNEFLEQELGHNYNRSGNSKIPYNLYDTFLVNMWREKERLLPLKMLTTEGLKMLSEAGVKPDLIYIDAGHDYEPVLEDIRLSLEYFPGAIIVGDDWDYKVRAL
jgi:predicted O-methyltransferase YrrM